MAYQQMQAPILKQEALAAHIFRIVLHCPSLAATAAPGQFVHILPLGFTLRRPISICEINKENGTLTIVLK